MLFSKKKETDAHKRTVEYLQNQNKENLETTVLILKQIQEINNEKAAGKGSFFKNYKQKQIRIDNVVSMAIETTEQKIMELG